MDAFVKSANLEVKISIDTPFVVIGEKINPTGRKKLAAAIAGRARLMTDIFISSHADLLPRREICLAAAGLACGENLDLVHRTSLNETTQKGGWM